MPLVSLDATITISLSVKDRHASASWYESMLGFEAIYHADEAGWSELQTKTAGVTIGPGEHTEPHPEIAFPYSESLIWMVPVKSSNRPKSGLMVRQTSSKAWSRRRLSTTPMEMRSCSRKI